MSRPTFPAGSLANRIAGSRANRIPAGSRANRIKMHLTDPSRWNIRCRGPSLSCAEFQRMPRPYHKRIVDPIELFAQHYVISESLQSQPVPPRGGFAVASNDAEMDHGCVPRGLQSGSIPEKKLSGGSGERKGLDSCCFASDSETGEDDSGDSKCLSCGKSHNRLSRGESADLSSALLSSLKAIWLDRYPIQWRVRNMLSDQSAEFRKNPGRFPDLPAQLVRLLAKAANPESHESLQKLSTHGFRRPRFNAREGESPHGFTFDLDVPKDLFDGVLDVDFWITFLETCFYDQEDHLPIVAEKMEAPSMDPHATLLLLWTNSDHCMAVLIGKVQYEWVNPTNGTKGSCERLQAALLRVEDGKTHNAFFLSTHVVPSDSDTDSEIDVEPLIRGHRGEDQFVSVHDPDSLDSQHPTNTLFRYKGEDEGAMYVHLRGRERPGSHKSGQPVVSLFEGPEWCPAFDDYYRIESVRPVREILEGGHLILEIGSRRLCQDFNFLQLNCRDSGRNPQNDEILFREIFNALEQVFFNGKISFCYPLLFGTNWCTPKPYDEGDQFEAAFVFPTGEDGAGLMARTVIRLSEKKPESVVEVHTNFVTVGRRRDFYLDTSCKDPSFNVMVGSYGFSPCRAALQMILNGACNKKEVNMNPNTSWTDAMKETCLLEFNKINRKSSNGDPRDLRNVAGFLEVIAAGSIPDQHHFKPDAILQEYDVHMVSDHECLQNAVFGLRNFDSRNPSDLIALITVSRIIRETDRYGKTLSGRRKATARPANGRARINQVAIDLKITFEGVKNELWPPKERKSNGYFPLRGVGEIVFEKYLGANGIWVPIAGDLLDAFKNGGKVNVVLNDPWDRIFYMGRVVSMRKKIEKLLGMICVFAGGAPPAYFPLAFESFPPSLVSGGSFISGENEVPNKYVELEISKNHRPFQDNLSIKIEVSIIKDENGHGGISSSNTAVLNQAQVRYVLRLGSKQCLCHAVILNPSPLAGIGRVVSSSDSERSCESCQG